VDTRLVDSVKSHRHLSLSEAQVFGRLEEFVLQEEVRGVGPAVTRELDDALSQLVTAAKSEDQTSRFAFSDGLSGTKAR
jgi:hypothetical protein